MNRGARALMRVGTLAGLSGGTASAGSEPPRPLYLPREVRDMERQLRRTELESQLRSAELAVLNARTPGGRRKAERRVAAIRANLDLLPEAAP